MADVGGRPGLRCPEPIFPVQDLDAAMAFYGRLGFRVRSYDSGYGYAQREALKIHLRVSPEVDPFANPCALWVEVEGVDALHEEWLACDLWLLRGPITPELDAEARDRWARGERTGRMSVEVEDRPWHVREFALLDLDNNQLRFGRRLKP
jgi:hypothetical protein